MAELVCPRCQDRSPAGTITEEVEVTGTAWREWHAEIRRSDGCMVINVGRTETDAMNIDYAGHGTLHCSCGWSGQPHELTQIDWEGKPVFVPPPEQTTLLPYLTWDEDAEAA